MSNSDNLNTTDRVAPAPQQTPDSPNHLNKIMDEVRNAPPEPKFYGINIGIAKLGFTSDGAFNPGIDLGIVHAQVKVGAVNGADAGVNLGPVGEAHAGAYAGVDQNGFKGNGGAGGHVLGLVGADGHVDTRLGNATGADVGAGAFVGPIGSRAGVGAAIGQDGLDAAVGGGARAGRVAGLHAGGHVGLNRDSEVGVGGGAHLGDLGGRTAVGVYSDGNSGARFDVDGRGHAGRSRGGFDVNPAYRGDAGDGYAMQPGLNARNSEATQLSGLGRPAPIESRPLPPVHEAATPEALARVDRQIRTEMAHQASYTVHKGDTYQKIAERLHPNDPQAQIDAFAAKLQKMHEGNGYHSLKPGMKLNTEDPYVLDRKVRAAVAQHFGWPAPGR